MKENITNLAENLINASLLKEKLYDKDYWIKKAATETDFIPMAGDWIAIDVALHKIVVHVYHKASNVNESKHWINGHWYNNSFTSDYISLAEMLEEIKVGK